MTAGQGDGASMITGNQSQAEWLSLRQNVTNSRKVLNQALAYVGAFLCSYIFVSINGFTVLFAGREGYVTLQIFQYILYPLQGEFDLSQIFLLPSRGLHIHITCVEQYYPFFSVKALYLLIIEKPSLLQCT